MAQCLAISIYQFSKGETDMAITESFKRAWSMVNDPSLPIDLDGVIPEDRAYVMVYRKDCEVDLTGLSPSYRAWVLENRPDYKPGN